MIIGSKSSGSAQCDYISDNSSNNRNNTLSIGSDKTSGKLLMLQKVPKIQMSMFQLRKEKR